MRRFVDRVDIPIQHQNLHLTQCLPHNIHRYLLTKATDIDIDTCRQVPTNERELLEHSVYPRLPIDLQLIQRLVVWGLLEGFGALLLGFVVLLQI